MKNPPPNATTWTAVFLVALGLFMIYLGWNGAAGADAAGDLRAQFPYLLSGGLFGLALVGAGLTLVRVYESRRDSKEVVASLKRLTEAVEHLAASQVHHVVAPDHVAMHHDVAVQELAPDPRLQPLPPAPVGVGLATSAPPPFERGR